MAGGRPSDYNQDIARAICLRLAEGESLRSVCRDDAMPPKGTVLRWIGIHAEFRDQYAQAKVDGAEALAEEMFEIADDATNDYMVDIELDEDGKEKAAGYRLMGENIQRSKLRIDTRKWYLSKIMPKKYGDKLELNNVGLPTVIIKDLSGRKDEPATDD